MMSVKLYFPIIAQKLFCFDDSYTKGILCKGMVMSQNKGCSCLGIIVLSSCLTGCVLTVFISLILLRITCSTSFLESQCKDDRATEVGVIIAASCIAVVSLCGIVGLSQAFWKKPE